MTLRTIAFFIGLGLMLTVFYLSVLIPYIPKGPEIPHMDKVYHFIAYFGMMIWWAQLYQGKSRFYALLAILAFGVMIEFVQPLTGRYFEVADIFANSFGAVFAWWLAHKGGDILVAKLAPKRSL